MWYHLNAGIYKETTAECSAVVSCLEGLCQALAMASWKSFWSVKTSCL